MTRRSASSEATQTHDAPLLWIVPGRRAVITNCEGGRRVTYEEALKSWVAELEAHQDVFLRWYEPFGAEIRGYKEAFERARNWVKTFAQGPTSAATEACISVGDTGCSADRHGTIDRTHLFARIWKGPLRVLLEEERDGAASEAEAEAPPAAEGEEPELLPEYHETTVDHGGSSRLLLNTRMEVTNHDAVFLAGDVLEFPLFRF